MKASHSSSVACKIFQKSFLQLSSSTVAQKVHKKLRLITSYPMSLFIEFSARFHDFSSSKKGEKVTTCQFSPDETSVPRRIRNFICVTIKVLVKKKSILLTGHVAKNASWSSFRFIFFFSIRCTINSFCPRKIP